MGHTNSTPNYSLPQFLGGDKPAWLTDVNQAYSAIDTAIKNAADAASGAASTASGASTAASNAGTAAANAQAAATAAGNQAATNAGAITTLQSRCAALEAAIATLNSYKHIVSSTVESGWRIDRYSDGSIRGRFEGTVTFTNAGEIANGWYRSILQMSIPFNVVQAQTDAYGAGANSGRLAIVIGASSSNTVELELLAGSSFPGGIAVTNMTVIVEGVEA